MKILYTTDQVYKHGGIEKVLSQKANWLAEVGGDEVYIVTYNQLGKPPVYNFSEKIKFVDLGINYIEGTSYFHPKNLLKVPKHKAALKKIIRELKPDVVVSCSFGPDFYFIPEIEKQIPKVKEFHGSRFFSAAEIQSWRKKIQKKKTDNAEAKYNALVVLNDDEQKYFNNGSVTVIPNPTEKTEISAGISSKKIVAAGRISPVKNFGALVEIFAVVHAQYPDWELHFYGEDYLGTTSTIQNRIKELDLQSGVKFMGVSDNLKKTMQDYSIYAMTSLTECFPMVLLEALSVGMPVISFDVPTGPKHILTADSDSFLVPDKNLDIFAEKLQQLMSDENLRKQMGENGKHNAQRFEISKVMNQWKNLFESLM